MPADKTLERAAAFFAALADPGRLLVLREVRRAGLTVTEIRGLLDCSENTISRHLRLLEEARLVAWRSDPRDRRRRVITPGPAFHRYFALPTHVYEEES